MDRLWGPARLEDQDLYLRMRKVEPLDRMFEGSSGARLGSGVGATRRTIARQMRPLDSVRGRWSLRPLLSWNAVETFLYSMQDQALPITLFRAGLLHGRVTGIQGPRMLRDPGEDSAKREDGNAAAVFWQGSGRNVHPHCLA